MRRIGISLVLLLVMLVVVSSVRSEEEATSKWTSTRILDTKQHERKWPGSYPFRNRSDYVLRELDLQVGDTAIDIGAGDGWWSEKMAKYVGETGTVYAAEIAEKKSRFIEKEV